MYALQSYKAAPNLSATSALTVLVSDILAVGTNAHWDGAGSSTGKPPEHAAGVPYLLAQGM